MTGPHVTEHLARYHLHGAVANACTAHNCPPGSPCPYEPDGACDSRKGLPPQGESA